MTKTEDMRRLPRECAMLIIELEDGINIEWTSVANPAWPFRDSYWSG